MEILGGSGYRARPSKKQVQAVKEGGIRADIIKKASQAHHAAVEEPYAEAMLLQALKQSHDTPPVPTDQTPLAPLSFWQQARQFFSRFF